MAREAVSVDRKPQKDPVTLALLHAVFFINGADVALLPSSFRALEASIGLAPSDLAALSLAQALAMSLTMPLWGALLGSGTRPKVLLVIGSFAWGLLTLLLSNATRFSAMLSLRLLVGASLGMLMPVGQTIVAECTASGERGVYFGTVQCCYMLGVLACGVYTSAISNWEVPLGAGIRMEGWRLAFASIALLSLLLSATLAACMRDPPRLAGPSRRKFTDGSLIEILTQELMVLRACWSINTFKVILIQGAFGCVPWNALNFTTMYFQYCNFSDFHAASLAGAMALGSAFGYVLGGWIGDRLTACSRFHGRPLTAQITVFVGIPLCYAIFAWPPSGFAYAYLLNFIFGLAASWAGPGVNKPMLTEIIEPDCWASTLAWIYATDESFAAVFGAPAVGLLVDNVFGYQRSRLLVGQMSEAMRESNREALSRGILACCIGPWILCFIFYSLLHFTYSHDVRDDDDEGERRPLASSAQTKPAR